MEKGIIDKFVKYCSNGHTPLSLQKLLKEKASSMGLNGDHLIWFRNYIHRVRDLVRSEPGYQTMLGFKDGATHTSYSLMKLYGKDSHASYAAWLEKLDEIGILCRYDQEDNLEKWGKKKVYGINPTLNGVAKIILEVINKKYFSPSI